MRYTPLLLVALLAPGRLVGQGARLAGTLVDADTRAPIAGATVTLSGAAREIATDADGRFRFERVAPGRHVLRVQHLAYGTHADSITLAPDAETVVIVVASPRAIEQEPVRVTALARRAGGRRTNVITREAIEKATPTARHLADVIRSYIPSAQLREFSGGGFCLEFRGAHASRFQPSCNAPLVVVDGLPVSQPTLYLRDTPPDEIERIEFIPASEAAARYGVGSQNGVLEIRTRHAEPVRRR
ncbi:MAG: carboxypeptidase regulatory-like domain-containing protein [Gemmatimonadetes bacterium]|nr:carboxypeptidase regulatory-like domain-containing protein [Gemmatimonadota bacterium]